MGKKVLQGMELADVSGASKLYQAMNLHQGQLRGQACSEKLLFLRDTGNDPRGPLRCKTMRREREVASSTAKPCRLT